MASYHKSLGMLNDEFSIRDVGSTLLEELAKGLYQPNEVIREYVQNAVDAHRIWAGEHGTRIERPIQIEVRGNRLSILDYGIGMDEEQIRKVKSIAVSQKRDADVELTGHKGVGIWAGLSFFRSLRLFSTTRGSNKGYELRLNFDRIVKAIGPEVDIGEALNPNYSVEIFEADIDEHYTDVTLEDPVRASEFLLNPEQVMNAVRAICPCELDDSFGLFDQVSSWYNDNRFEFFPILVNAIPVKRSYSSYVERFETGSITVNDTVAARYWKAFHKKNGVISANPDQLVGFRLFQNGFVLGDANPYTQTMQGFEDLRLQNYPDWYAGEIHLVSRELRPDLKRRQLEESEAARQFIGRLREWYTGIEQDARALSGARNHLKTYERLERTVSEVEQNAAVPLMALSQEQEQELESILDELKKDEERAKKGRQNKRKPLEPKIRALWEVRAPRKKLMSRIESMLPRDMESGVFEEAAGAEVDAPPARSVESSQGDHSVDDNDKDDIKATTSAPTIAIGWKKDVPSMDVILGLLNEVLLEELSDNPEKRLTIFTKLEQRVLEVLTDV